jgi:hypothetical protein
MKTQISFTPGIPSNTSIARLNSALFQTQQASMKNYVRCIGLADVKVLENTLSRIQDIVDLINTKRKQYPTIYLHHIDDYMDIQAMLSALPDNLINEVAENLLRVQPASPDNSKQG